MIAIYTALVLAQLLPGNANGVAMGHLHLNVSDLAAAQHFWVDVLGATPAHLTSHLPRRIGGHDCLARRLLRARGWRQKLKLAALLVALHIASVDCRFDLRHHSGQVA